MQMEYFFALQGFSFSPQTPLYLSQSICINYISVLLIRLNPDEFNVFFNTVQVKVINNLNKVSLFLRLR